MASWGDWPRVVAQRLLMCLLRSDRRHSENGTPAPTDAAQTVHTGPSARRASPSARQSVAATDHGRRAPERAAGIAAARRANPPELSVWCRDASGRRAILRRGVMMAALGALVETHATIGASYRTSMPKYPI